MQPVAATLMTIGLAVAATIGSSVLAKPRTLVTGSWQHVPATANLGTDIPVTLRLEASADAPSLHVVLRSARGLSIIRGDREWSGSIAKDQVIDLPFTVRILGNGDWTLGASITNKRPDADQVSGALLRVRARDGVASLTTP